MPDKPPAPQRVAEASAPAPFIYFDIVPNFGFNVARQHGRATFSRRCLYDGTPGCPEPNAGCPYTTRSSPSFAALGVTPIAPSYNALSPQCLSASAAARDGGPLAPLV